MWFLLCIVYMDNLTFSGHFLEAIKWICHPSKISSIVDKQETDEKDDAAQSRPLWINLLLVIKLGPYVVPFARVKKKLFYAIIYQQSSKSLRGIKTSIYVFIEFHSNFHYLMIQTLQAYLKENCRRICNLLLPPIVINLKINFTIFFSRWNWV